MSFHTNFKFYLTMNNARNKHKNLCVDAKCKTELTRPDDRSSLVSMVQHKIVIIIINTEDPNSTLINQIICPKCMNLYMYLLLGVCKIDEDDTCGDLLSIVVIDLLFEVGIISLYIRGMILLPAIRFSNFFFLRR